ncbi:hypothetical protein NOS3756_60350 (plasmid) [Nostoc sp. NIES-3756]|uniref:hypothetical protein n=1 Tax=Nostoc sp. NIES-3756 TaxID=1751286 RepID=UPI00071F1B08|nr:hypothetical protein [Nostoc sp. NIES-3756]BAT57023.1 hypothetical protein NOS3756_60350 [Nostoc sp. NIES-3756]
MLTFLHAMKQFLRLLKPKLKTVQPTIESYGQLSCGVDPEQIQSVMEWLFASLLDAGYFEKSHIFWCDDKNPDSNLEQVVKKAIRRGEPIFLYRFGSRVQPPPNGYHWRMMEHPSMRVYQLEIKEQGH